MTDWYVSSAAYAAIPVWQASPHVYSVGDIIRPTAPNVNRQYTYRCTTGGTSSASEPNWNTSQNATTTNGTSVFTQVAGQATYNWTAPVGNVWSITNSGTMAPAAGDRVFVSSDHSETDAGSNYGFGSSGLGLIKFLSVSRAGSIPPVAADITNGASINWTAMSAGLDAPVNQFWQGFTFSQGSSSSLTFNPSSSKSFYLKNCTLKLTNSNSTCKYTCGGTTHLVLDNTTAQFGATSQSFTPSNQFFDLTWINTPSAIQGSFIPTTLFRNDTGLGFNVTCRGVDLSAETGTLVASQVSAGGNKALFDSCKIASGATRYGTPGASTPGLCDEVEFINCYDGTNVFNSRYSAAGAVTQDTSTYATAGAADDNSNFSIKMVTNATCDLFAFQLESFWLDVENTATGVSKTATVQIVSSASLNNTDIRLVLEYQGTAGSPVASFGDSLTGVLASSSALGSSAQSWNSPPATPQYQQLQVTFTPQKAGRVRGRVLLGKASTTVWVNPQITIT